MNHKTFPGSRRFAAALYREAIVEKVTLGLTAQRIWQDLVEEFVRGVNYFCRSADLLIVSAHLHALTTASLRSEE